MDLAPPGDEIGLLLGGVPLAFAGRQGDGDGFGGGQQIGRAGAREDVVAPKLVGAGLDRGDPLGADLDDADADIGRKRLG